LGEEGGKDKSKKNIETRKEGKERDNLSIEKRKLLRRGVGGWVVVGGGETRKKSYTFFRQGNVSIKWEWDREPLAPRNPGLKAHWSTEKSGQNAG